MNVRCAVVRIRLPGVDSVDELGGRLAGHVETCLRCQAEAARYRSLRRRIGALSRDLKTAPITLVPSVAARIEIGEPEMEISKDLRVGLRRAAVAMTAAAGAAVAATAGTLIVVGLRRSQHAA